MCSPHCIASSLGWAAETSSLFPPWVSQSWALKNTNVLRKSTCSSQGHEGGAEELVKTPGPYPTYWKADSLPRNSSLPAWGLRNFLTSYSFPYIAPGGPSTFKASENKSHTASAIKQPYKPGVLMECACSSCTSPQHSISSVCVYAPQQFPAGFSYTVSAFCCFHALYSTLTQCFSSWRN